MIVWISKRLVNRCSFHHCRVNHPLEIILRYLTSVLQNHPSYPSSLHKILPAHCSCICLLHILHTQLSYIYIHHVPPPQAFQTVTYSKLLVESLVSTTKIESYFRALTYAFYFFQESCRLEAIYSWCVAEWTQACLRQQVIVILSRQVFLQRLLPRMSDSYLIYSYLWFHTYISTAGMHPPLKREIGCFPSKA